MTSNQSRAEFNTGRRRKLRKWMESLEPRMLLSGATFSPAVSTTITNGLFPVVNTVEGDINGDGIPDVIAARTNLEAQIYLGTSTGTLTVSGILITGGNPIALGDFNNDGNLDLATASGIRLGDGQGNFAGAIAGFMLPTNAVEFYATDVNGDGNLDLVVTTFTSTGGGTMMQNPVMGVSVLLGNGDGSFKAAVNTTVGTAAGLTSQDATVAFGDFNGDGIEDLLTPFGTMIGSANSSFANAVPLPFSSNGAMGSVVPTSHIYAVGNFNGDSDTNGLPKEDIAIVAPDSKPGQVEIFLGAGNGTFTDNGPVLIGSTDTITALTASDLRATGASDLIAGIIASGNTADVAVLTNDGTGQFSAPALNAVPGGPLNIFVDDFNADGNPDLLSIDQSPGGVGNTGFAVSAAVLLNSQVQLPQAHLLILSSTNPVVAGSQVKFAAFVLATSGSAGGAPVPTGTVTFFNETTAIGTQTLVNGKASLTVTATGVGMQHITYSYSGDANYAPSTSTAIVERVLQTGDKVPLLIPTFGNITLPAEFIAGDSANVQVILTNGGGAIGRGKVSIALYLTETGLIDANAIPIPARSLQNRAVTIGSGGSVTLAGSFKAGTYPAGDYFLVAQVIPVSGFTSDDISTTPALSPLTFRAAGLVFGSVGKHHGLHLKLTDANGGVGMLTIAGAGTGNVTQSAAGFDVKITGATKATQVSITSRGGFLIHNFSVNGMLNTLSAQRTTITGNLTVSGLARQITLGAIASPTGDPTVANISGATTLALGSVGNVTLTSTGAINKLTASGWQSGALNAPAITNLTVAGAFSANINIHSGGKLQTVKIGTIAGGTWAISGGIGSLRTTGSVTSASIYAGADSGADNILGTSDDSFAAASIASLLIGAADASSVIVAGAAPLAGNTILTGLTLLPKGAILGITVRGGISDDSKILAAHKPPTALVGGARVVTATDPRFQV